MKVDILGHWAGAPVAGGACSSYLVRGRDATVLLDCGPGTLPLLQRRLPLQELDAIVLSHMHKDHILDLIPFTSARLIGGLNGQRSDWRKPKLFVPQEDGPGVLTAINRVWSHQTSAADHSEDPRDALYTTPNMFTDTFELAEYAPNAVIGIGSLRISFQRTHHAAPCFAMRVTDGDAVLAYSADTGYIPEIAPHVHDADLFICESTLVEPDPQLSQVHGHLTGDEAGAIAAEAAARRLVLTHLTPDAAGQEINLRNARRRFAGPVDLAQTGSVYFV